MLCGISFGFPFGLLPAYLGSWLGAMVFFLMSRALFIQSVQNYIQQNTSGTLAFARHMISEHQLKVNKHLLMLCYL